MVEHSRATCQPGTRYTAPGMSYTAAVVGLGTIAGAHLSAIGDQQRLRLTGVCDRDRDILSRRSAEASVPGFHDYRALLQTAPDVAVVALPHHLHCDVAVAALEAGCHVLVEKPLAVSVEQCRTMLQAARRARRTLAVSDTAAYHPGALRTGALVRGGTLGRFLSGMHHNVRFYFHAGRPAWFLDPAASGGGNRTCGHLPSDRNGAPAPPRREGLSPRGPPAAWRCAGLPHRGPVSFASHKGISLKTQMCRSDTRRWHPRAQR